MLTVEEVDNQQALGRYRDEWDDLVTAAPDGELFETYTWISAWLATYWRDRPIRFLFVRDGNDLAGLAPLLDDAAGLIGCRNSLVTPVNPHARRCGLLHDGRPAEVLEAVMTHLVRTRKGARLRMPCCDAASALVKAVENRGTRIMVRAKGPAPIVRIDGDWDGYLASRSRHLKRELARKARKLETEWNVKWITAAGADHERAMNDVFLIERNSWKDRRGTSMRSEPGAAEFYSRLARGCAANDWLRVELLFLDDRPAAHLCGVVYKSTYYALKTSYDEAFRAWSPGVLLCEHVLERAFDDGLSTFDFLGDECRWKTELSNDVREHVDACVFARDAYRCRWGAARENRLKPFLRERAPSLVALRRRLKSRMPG